MTRFATLLTSSLLALALAGPHGAALHCNGDIIALTAGAETLYIDDRSDKTGEIDHWFYLESNGIEGLQSGDNDCIFIKCKFGGFYDPCRHPIPDTNLLAGI